MLTLPIKHKSMKAQKRINKKTKRANKKNKIKKLRNITLFGDLNYSFLDNSYTFTYSDEEYEEGNYVGRLTGTVYEGGVDHTDYNISMMVSQYDLERGFKEDRFGDKITLREV
jgi:hypothetical protein